MVTQRAVGVGQWAAGVDIGQWAAAADSDVRQQTAEENAVSAIRRQVISGAVLAVHIWIAGA